MMRERERQVLYEREREKKNVRGLTGINVGDGYGDIGLGMNLLVGRRYFGMGPV